MQVTIRWREVNDYTSTITINEAVFAEFFDDVKEAQPDAQISEGWIKEYLDNGDEDDWFQQVDTNRDFDGTHERFITDVAGYQA